MEGKLRIYVDMDGVLCDVYKAYTTARLQQPLIKFPQSIHGFFRDLEEIKGACAAMRVLKDWGHDVWILTRPSTMNRLCYTEKADWVHKHLGQEWVEKLILCPDKSLLKGDLLIDDNPWPGFEGVQIQYGHGKYQCWADVLYTIQQLSLWKLNNP